MATCRRLISRSWPLTPQPDGEAVPFLDKLRIGPIVHARPAIPFRYAHATSVNVAVVMHRPIHRRIPEYRTWAAPRYRRTSVEFLQCIANTPRTVTVMLSVPMLIGVSTVSAFSSAARAEGMRCGPSGGSAPSLISSNGPNSRFAASAN